MNYQKIYNSLVERSKIRTGEISNPEIHHIIPRCMGGSDDKINLVRLSSREHFLAHLLLAKIHPKHPGVWYSAHILEDFKGHQPPTENYNLSKMWEGRRSPKSSTIPL